MTTPGNGPSYIEAVKRAAARRTAPDANMPNKNYANESPRRLPRPTARQRAMMKGRYVNKAGGVEALRGPND